MRATGGRYRAAMAAPADDVRVHALRCGALTAPGEAFVAGLDGEVDLQVWAFLVEHPSGTVLFDTGMHPSVRQDAPARLGGLADLFRITYGPDDDVASRLAEAATDVGDVDVVVSSHRRSMTDRAVRAHPRFDDATAVWRSGARRDPGEIPTRRIA